MSITAASMLGCILALGSAHSAGHFGSMFGYSIMLIFGDASFEFWFTFLTTVALMPVYFVYRGNGVVNGACNYADTQIENMKKAKQARIANLQTPDVTHESANAKS